MAETGDVQIFPPVAIEVGGQNAHGPARVSYAGVVGHVGEGAVAIIVVERAPRAFRIGSRFDGEGVREVDVQAAVVVIVEERDAAAHGLDNVFLLGRRNVLEAHAGGVRDVHEVHARRCFKDREEGRDRNAEK